MNEPTIVFQSFSCGPIKPIVASDYKAMSKEQRQMFLNNINSLLLGNNTRHWGVKLDDVLQT